MKITLLKTTAITMCMYVTMTLTTSKTFAQGNLQFNKVITQPVDASATSYTVPAGKVFKLEAITSMTPAGYYFYAGPLTFTTNGQIYIGGGAAGYWPFPIWLKAGDVVYSNYPGIGFVSISGIEFNIVP